MELSADEEFLATYKDEGTMGTADMVQHHPDATAWDSTLARWTVWDGVILGYACVLAYVARRHTRRLGLLFGLTVVGTLAVSTLSRRICVDLAFQCYAGSTRKKVRLATIARAAVVAVAFFLRGTVVTFIATSVRMRRHDPHQTTPPPNDGSAVNSNSLTAARQQQQEEEEEEREGGKEQQKQKAAESSHPLPKSKKKQKLDKQLARKLKSAGRPRTWGDFLKSIAETYQNLRVPPIEPLWTPPSSAATSGSSITPSIANKLYTCSLRSLVARVPFQRAYLLYGIAGVGIATALLLALSSPRNRDVSSAATFDAETGISGIFPIQFVYIPFALALVLDIAFVLYCTIVLTDLTVNHIMRR